MADNEKRAKEFYRWIKVVGFTSFIPITLAAGPIGGYILGDILVRRFHGPHFLSVLFTLSGLVAGIWETSKIIRRLVQLEKDDPR